MPIVVAEQLSKTYRVSDRAPGLAGAIRHLFNRRHRSIEALRSVSFSIEPGEVVGFLGPNGAGKTTALKLLTGLMHPTSGRAEVAGHTPFRRQRDFLERITLVMGHKQQLIWDLPAIDSLRINAAVYDLPDPVFRQRLDELRTLLEMGDELRQPVRKLSLGQRMKAELIAALLHRPSVLFLDEPTLGLDVNAQAGVRQFLQEYNRAHGAAILLTSHYMADITALCRRVIVIHQGSLMYDGDLDDLVRRYAPAREVKLEFQQPISRERLQAYGEVESCEGRVASLIVPRESLTRIVQRLLDETDVCDLEVKDPPIEKVIGRLFRDGAQTGAQP